MKQLLEPISLAIFDPPRLIQAPQPFRPSLPHVGWILGALLLLTLLPRVLMTAKFDVVCSDGVLYIELAQAIERGDLEHGLGPMWVNTYLLALAGLHACGLEWVLAGKIWGVAVASLAVLPLFGWVRRMTDTRVAVLAAMLYAVHPKFIEWSAEQTRDATFWLFAALSLYLTFRAVTEIRWFWFVAAGAALTLAVHTRFEGWFLFIPLVAWASWRMLALRQARGRLVFGLVCALCVCPLTVATINVTWLRDHPQRQWGDFQRLKFVQHWLVASTDEPVSAAPASDERNMRAEDNSTSAPARALADSPATGSAPLPAQSALPATTASNERCAAASVPRELLPASKAAGIFLRTLIRGFEPVYVLLLFIGWWAWGGVWVRRDFQPLFHVAICVLGGIWIHLLHAHVSSSRYALFLVILSLPTIAVGFLAACRGLQVLAGRLSRCPSFGSVLCGAALVVGLVGWADALTSRDPTRLREAELGKWLRREYGPHRCVEISESMPIVNHYAECSRLQTPFSLVSDDPVTPPDSRADVLVLARRHVTAEKLQSMVDVAASRGWKRVADGRLPANCRSGHFVVFEHEGPLAAVPSLQSR